MKKILMVMSKNDNVATALMDISKNETVEIIDHQKNFIINMVAKSAIPFGNKIALCTINEGTDVIKYGHIIGQTVANIGEGCLVHVHNVKSKRVDIPVSYKKEICKQMNIEEALWNF